MGFQQAFEKELNKDLEEHRGPSPPIDIVYQQDPPQAHTFVSYPPPPRRSGMWVPTYLLVLFVLVLLFESSILFVYTIVALYNTLPASLIPVNAVQVPACSCPSSGFVEHLPGINSAPNIMVGYHPPAVGPAADVSQLMLGAQATVTVTDMNQHEATITVTATPTSSSDTEGTAGSDVNTSTNTTSVVSTSSTKTSPHVVTVTAPVPTITVLSTESQPLPSITTEIVLSTATPVRPTVTATTVITARSAISTGLPCIDAAGNANDCPLISDSSSAISSVSPSTASTTGPPQATKAASDPPSSSSLPPTTSKPSPSPAPTSLPKSTKSARHVCIGDLGAMANDPATALGALGLLPNANWGETPNN
ncbi:hypothetical protein M8818_001593 [Zalaria obscura]|uniref:Uncharacterized protein n=1 Tax=Zalaria obscura TaxID=2024903 RepID=A0ACC3SKT5_9PEZI